MVNYFDYDYEPLRMDFNLEKEKIPETYMIKDIKHLLYKESYCESTAFQMILYDSTVESFEAFF